VKMTRPRKKESFARLEAWVREHFHVRSIDYRWSAELLDPADGLPYIGNLNGVAIATGFSSEGLLFGTLAAQMLAAQYLGQPHPCADILKPTRFKPLAAAAGFLSENLGTMKHFIQDRFSSASEGDVSLGQGSVQKLNGKDIAVYYDQEGNRHTLSAVCPHMGCIVAWNPAAQSWDCPCHGGRFDCTGEVISGPPMHGLEDLSLKGEN
jgi:Rieske Fe-S protein